MVEADLSKDAKFMSWIEHSEDLSRTDFYLDMNGNGGSGLVSAESYDEQYTLYIKAVVAVLSFIVFHMIGCRIGLFPRLIPIKKKKGQD